jgi:3-hydroxybutyryl-CoA dehydrogenase
LSLDQLEGGTLPKTDILLLPEYYNLDDETQPADLNTGLVGVNEVIYVSESALPEGCFYYNGWPRPAVNQALTLEMAGKADVLALVKEVLGAYHIPCATAPCTPGLLSARVIAMIINEAHLLLQEGHASAPDIDLSMRLGTAYPLGPFEWEQLWGEAKTKALLAAMAEREPDVVIPYFGR